MPVRPDIRGNLREKGLDDIWKNSPIFKDLSDRSKLKGKCGECENKNICGGCRGKAYGISGDPLAEDPCCYLHFGTKKA